MSVAERRQRMSRVIDLTGQRFGRLTVIERGESSKRGEACWRCRCDCGREIVARSYPIRQGKVKSCGCLSVETLVKRSKGNEYTKTHGLSGSRIYKIYYAMLSRCYNPKRWNYDKYGGRGISVCEEWRNDFMAFYTWAMANGYDDTKSIDRIDPNGNYEPANCRFTNASVQGLNRNVQSNNSTGVKGVTRLKNGKFRAYIKKSGKQVPLGCYDTLEQAKQVRETAEKELLK